MTTHTRYTIKQILLSNQNWWKFYTTHQHNIRFDILFCIIKLLSCKNKIRGYHQYVCSNKQCTHIKKIAHTCKAKACSSCGKKATELWLRKQIALLPNTTWQHITFTMPQPLWDFFWYNRHLLNDIGKIAANTIKTLAHKKKLTPGIFIAIHTFGRNLKRNVHVHLSTTLGGITQDHNQWKKLYFHQNTLMKMWRFAVIKLFRDNHHKGIVIPKSINTQINHTFTFNHFLNALYKKQWIVHCAKPSADFKKNLQYLSRYIKRPAIAESKLKHYDGHEVVFNYLDHKTKTYRKLKITAQQFIARFIQHIPDIGFRMIRYYGFLANRVRTSLLPKVTTLLGQNTQKQKTNTNYADLMQKNFGINPLTCILCKCTLILAGINFGKATRKLLAFHRDLALMKKI